MRKVLVTLSLLALTVPAYGQSQKVFDFMGADTESAVPDGKVGGKRCADKGDGEASCTFFNATLGEARVDIVMVNLYNGKISSVLGIAPRRSFLSLLSAFTAKYGAPEMETREWRNGAGARLDNEVAVWRFKGGNLELASIGSKLSQSDFQFFSSENLKPTEAPKVNF